MGLSSSKTIVNANKQKALQVTNALGLLSYLQPFQTKFFSSDETFEQSSIVVEAVIRQFLGTSKCENVIVIEPQNDKPTFTMTLSLGIVNEVRHWLNSLVLGISLLCTQIIHGVGHTVVIILQKREHSIYSMYLDPRGFPLQQGHLLAKALLSSLGLVTNSVQFSHVTRDTEQALWLSVREVAKMDFDVWRLYLFSTSHNMLASHNMLLSYKRQLRLNKHSSKIYDKLVRLLPNIKKQGLL